MAFAPRGADLTGVITLLIFKKSCMWLINFPLVVFLLLAQQGLLYAQVKPNGNNSIRSCEEWLKRNSKLLKQDLPSPGKLLKSFQREERKLLKIVSKKNSVAGLKLSRESEVSLEDLRSRISVIITEIGRPGEMGIANYCMDRDSFQNIAAILQAPLILEEIQKHFSERFGIIQDELNILGMSKKVFGIKKNLKHMERRIQQVRNAKALWVKKIEQGIPGISLVAPNIWPGDLISMPAFPAGNNIMSDIHGLQSRKDLLKLIPKHAMNDSAMLFYQLSSSAKQFNCSNKSLQPGKIFMPGKENIEMNDFEVGHHPLRFGIDIQQGKLDDRLISPVQIAIGLCIGIGKKARLSLGLMATAGLANKWQNLDLAIAATGTRCMVEWPLHGGWKLSVECAGEYPLMKRGFVTPAGIRPGGWCGIGKIISKPSGFFKSSSVRMLIHTVRHGYFQTPFIFQFGFSR
jgi:hypothetical protein